MFISNIGYDTDDTEIVSENEKLNKLFKQGWYIVDHKITCSPHDEVYMSILLERVKK